MIVVCRQQGEPAFGHHLGEISKAELVSQDPQRTQSTMISWSKCRPLKSPSIFVCARQLCRSTDLPTTMLCPSSSHQSPVEKALNAKPSDFCLIASHTWDTLGAVAAGWKAALIKRPWNDVLDVGPQPQIVGEDLNDVADQLIARRGAKTLFA